MHPTVLPENEAALMLLRRTGWSLVSGFEGGELSVAVTLPDTPAGAHHGSSHST